MAVRSIGPAFWEICRFPPGWSFSVLLLGTGLEEVFPWRHGRCLIIRAPFTPHGVAIGVWLGLQAQGEDEDGPFLELRSMDLEEFARAQAPR